MSKDCNSIVRWYKIEGERAETCIKDLIKRKLAMIIDADAINNSHMVLISDAKIDLARYRADIDHNCTIT